MRRVSIIPTIVVLIAVATMIALGIWQLRRADEKAELIKRYELAATLPVIDFPASDTDTSALFRRASGVCLTVEGMTARAGSNRTGETGFRHLAQCRAGEGIEITVDYGWSRKPDKAPWGGGAVSGVIGPDADRKILLVANTPAAGLEASALPDIRNVPNNHLGYAIQWFCFAIAALVIYGLALRRRLVASEGNQG